MEQLFRNGGLALPTALAFSLMAHAVLLSALPKAKPRARGSDAASIVSITLAFVPGAPSRPAATAPPPPSKKTDFAARRVRRPPEAPTPRAAPLAEPVREVPDVGGALSLERTETDAPPTASDSRIDGQGDGDRNSASRAPSAGPPDASARPRVEESISLEPIRQAIDRKLVYPLRARRMGWTGRVVVVFELDEGGWPNDLRVLETSGHPALDAAALVAVQRAAPFAATGRRSAPIAVPVAFSLSPL
jgi:protein TonB